MVNLRSIFNYIPEIKKPDEKKLSFNVKAKWTLIVLVAFFVLANLPLFRLSENACAQFEFLAIILALAWLKKHKLSYPIYSDSKTAMAWVRNKRVNTKLERTSKNTEIFKALDNGVAWLKINPVHVKILKWETKIWGEIPADYGRK